MRKYCARRIPLIAFALYLPPMVVFAGISDGWICVDGLGNDLRCSNSVGDEYRHAGGGGGFFDFLRSKSIGVEISKTCKDTSVPGEYVSLWTRSCSAFVLAWGSYGERLKKAFGPQGNHLQIEAQGLGMKIWTIEKGVDGHEKKELFLSSQNFRQGGLAEHFGLQVKIREDFLTYYAESVDRNLGRAGVSDSNLPKTDRFKKWLEEKFSDENSKGWEREIQKAKRSVQEQKEGNHFWWICFAVGFLLNIVMCWGFCRCEKFKDIFLMISVSFLIATGIMGIVMLVIGNPFLFFGLWAGLTFPFSLLGYPAAILFTWLCHRIEFWLLNGILVGIPFVAISGMGSYFMWTVFFPKLSSWMNKDA